MHERHQLAGPGCHAEAEEKLGQAVDLILALARQELSAETEPLSDRGVKALCQEVGLGTVREELKQRLDQQLGGIRIVAGQVEENRAQEVRRLLNGVLDLGGHDQDLSILPVVFALGRVSAWSDEEPSP